MKIILLVLPCVMGGILNSRPKNSEAPSLLSITEVPFFVTIFHNCDPKCSAAMISVTHAITAAHCVVDERLQKHRNITVESGTDRFHEGGLCHEVEDVVVAPGYSNENLLNDIAIITLSRRVRFEDYIDIPILGLPSEEPEYGEAAGLVGFENMVPPEGAPLRLIPTKIQSAKDCRMFDIDQYLDHSSKICAINDVPTQLFPNNGDGAPLANHGNIVGVVSAQGTARYDVLYYTNVHQFVPFIRSVIGESSKDLPHVNLKDWFKNV